MRYFLIMLSDWRFSAPGFKHRLLARWPNALIEEEADAESLDCLEFKLRMAHSVLEGSLRRDGSGLALDGDIRDIAELALWVRGVPHSGSFARAVYGDQVGPSMFDGNER